MRYDALRKSLKGSAREWFQYTADQETLESHEPGKSSKKY